MTSPTFVYAPCSGPRWIGNAGPRDEITVPTVVWPNQSAHVVGTVLSFNASSPSNYWRHEAREAAEAVALGAGGIAWDECGVVCLAVPPWLAQTAIRHMWAVRAAACGDRVESEALALIHPFAPWGEDFVNVLRALGPAGPSEIGRLMRRRAEDGGDPPPPKARVQQLLSGQTEVSIGKLSIASPWDSPEIFGAVVERDEADPAPAS